MSGIIEVRDLRKTFRVSERETGMGATLRAFVKRRYKDVPAIAGIDTRALTRRLRSGGVKMAA